MAGTFEGGLLDGYRKPYKGNNHRNKIGDLRHNFRSQLSHTDKEKKNSGMVYDGL